MEKDDNKNKNFTMDVYYLNRGIWIAKEIELTVLFPLITIIMFQNFFATILSILLIIFLIYLNKRGFQYNTALRMIAFFFKKEILPIDDYDYEYFRKRHLYKDSRFTSEEVSKQKIYLNKKDKSINNLRL